MKETYRKSIELGIANSNEFDLRDTRDTDEPDEFYGDLRMGPRRSAPVKETAKALVIGVLDDTPATKGNLLTEATIESPTSIFEQMRYLNLRMSGIWVYNQDTGKVFLKMLPLTTKTKKFSYALGMNIGSGLGTNLKKQSVEFDSALVAKGLNDSMTGGTSL